MSKLLKKCQETIDDTRALKRKKNDIQKVLIFKKKKNMFKENIIKYSLISISSIIIFLLLFSPAYEKLCSVILYMNVLIFIYIDGLIARFNNLNLTKNQRGFYKILISFFLSYAVITLYVFRIGSLINEYSKNKDLYSNKNINDNDLINVNNEIKMKESELNKLKEDILINDSVCLELLKIPNDKIGNLNNLKETIIKELQNEEQLISNLNYRIKNKKTISID